MTQINKNKNKKKKRKKDWLIKQINLDKIDF